MASGCCVRMRMPRRSGLALAQFHQQRKFLERAVELRMDELVDRERVQRDHLADARPFDDEVQRPCRPPGAWGRDKPCWCLPAARGWPRTIRGHTSFPAADASRTAFRSASGTIPRRHRFSGGNNPRPAATWRCPAASPAGEASPDPARHSLVVKSAQCFLTSSAAN